MKNAGVVIVNWNRKEDTKETLRSLLKSDLAGVNLEIVVVDNGSTDGSKEEIYEFLSKNSAGLNFKVLFNSQNLGFCEGNNIGIKHLLRKNCDNIILLNNDTVVDPLMVKNLVTFSERHGDAGAVSPKIYFAKGFEFHKKKYKNRDLGKVIWYAGGKIDWNNVYGMNVGVDEVDHGQYDKVREIDFATGCCVLFTKKALSKAGLFDKRYFAYLEDMDLSQKVRKKGFKIFYEPKAILWHKVSRSSGIGSGLNDYFITRNRMLFGFTYASFRTKLALFKESVRFLFLGRDWQRIGVMDFYLGNFGKGSWR